MANKNSKVITTSVKRGIKLGSKIVTIPAIPELGFIGGEVKLSIEKYTPKDKEEGVYYKLTPLASQVSENGYINPFWKCSCMTKINIGKLGSKSSAGEEGEEV